MEAAIIVEYGGPEKFELRETPRPNVSNDDVLVEVKCASINPIDWKLRKGDISLLLPQKFPRVLGTDLSGVVAEVGTSVKGLKVGDRVFGMADAFRNQFGSYAQFSLAQESKLAKMPDSLSFENAASIPVAGLTAYKSLYELGRMRPGQQVFINGASGGVGTFAVQLAKVGGAKVTATCGKDNLDFMQALGADVVLNYQGLDYSKMKEKFSIILDATATLDYFAVQHLMTDHGVFITTVPRADTLLAIAMTAPFSGKKAHLVLASMGDKIPQELSELGNLVANSKLHPVITGKVSLRELANAHREAERGHTRGKVLVRIAE